jgi:uncharacterized coiled-coil protein SlyX
MQSSLSNLKANGGTAGGASDVAGAGEGRGAGGSTVDKAVIDQLLRTVTNMENTCTGLTKKMDSLAGQLDAMKKQQDETVPVATVPARIAPAEYQGK